ncbi:MAG: hypothetical protein J6M62_00545 [Selenomonadaceae bacterium]|nr:hypothetical protein [Selenomonadaceae bacterium]MBP3722250.1 hypothetical protein [Selenomonadaceae bacterium]
MAKTALKRLVCVAAISAVALTAAGCDDDDNDRRRYRAHRDDHKHYDGSRDRRDHRPPPPPPKERNVKDGSKKERPPKDRKHPPRPPREKKSLEGCYSATALNDAVVQRGKSYYIDIFEENGETFLELPNGKKYPVVFNNGFGTVAGGSIFEQDEGKFFYNDKNGGAWLIEKIEE